MRVIERIAELSGLMEMPRPRLTSINKPRDPFGFGQNPQRKNGISPPGNVGYRSSMRLNWDTRNATGPIMVALAPPAPVTYVPAPVGPAPMELVPEAYTPAPVVAPPEILTPVGDMPGAELPPITEEGYIPPPPRYAPPVDEKSAQMKTSAEAQAEEDKKNKKNKNKWAIGIGIFIVVVIAFLVIRRMMKKK